MFCTKKNQQESLLFWTIITFFLLGTFCVSATFLTKNQFLFGQEAAPTQPAAPAPAQPAAPSQNPGETIPTDIKNAAVEAITLPENIPSPTESPAEAAALAQTVENEIANPTPQKPEPSKPEEPVKLEQYDPSKSYSQLLFPHMAELVGLSDSQKMEVERLMTERSKSLGAAKKEDWNKIVLDSESALKAILTPQQAERFKLGQIEKKIVLRFNKENWKDVLDWFAAEVGLQLVMTAPPPGTFSYIDKNMYSPKKALDIINARLQIEGYTLIRYGEMLILHNLKSGPFPLQYLPKITPEDLPNQGNFDYVALTLPLERRDMNAVRQTIQPFMGPYCSLKAMPGNSLLIVDSVNVLREITAAAMSVHNPDPPRQEDHRRPEGPPPVPEWVDYPLTKVKPSVVQEQIAIFAPDAKPLINPAATQISYLAVPALQKVIKGLIDRLEAGADPTKDLMIHVYSLEGLTSVSPQDMWILSRRLGSSNFEAFMKNMGVDFGNEIKEMLKKLTPDAEIELNPSTKKIIAIAHPIDQAKIAEVFEKLKIGPSNEEQPVIKVYRFKNPANRIDAQIMQTVKSFVPIAQTTLDSVNGTLMVIATAKEQAVIAKALEEIEMNIVEVDNANERVLVVYPMTIKQLQRFNLIYPQVAPTLKMTGVVRIADGSRNRLTIWAKPFQQAQIEKLINEITGADYFKETEIEKLNPQGLPVLKSQETPPTPTPAATEEPAPAPATPTPTPAATEKLFVVSSAEDSSTSEEPVLLPGGRTNAYMMVLPMRKITVATADSLLVNTIPGLEITIDYYSNSLIIYGSKSMVESAANLIDEIENGLNTVFKIVPLSKQFPTEALTAVQRIEPRVSITQDLKNERLFVYGKITDVERVLAFIETILKTTPTEEESFYYMDVERDIPTSTLDFIRRNWPRVDIQYDSSNKRFMIIGTPTEQLLVAKLITEAENNLPPDQEIRFYTFENKVTDRMIKLLQNAVPQIPSIQRDEYNPCVLIIEAKPPMHKKIETVLEKIKTEYPMTVLNELRAYPITSEIRKRFEMIKADFEKDNGAIRILDSENANQILVFALPQQHEAFAALLTQLGSIDDGPKDVPMFYTPKYVASDTIVEVLTNLYSEVKIKKDSIDGRLIIQGKSEDLAEIRELLKNFDVKETDGMVRYFKQYSVKGFYSYDSRGNYYSPTYYLRDLEKLVPAAKLTFNYYDQQLVVWGTEEEHKIISESVSQMNDNNDLTRKVLRHEIRRQNGNILVSLIYQVFPRAIPTFDKTANSLIIRGTNVDLEEVRQFLDLVDPENPSPLDPVLKYYPLSSEPTDDLVAALKELVPEAARIDIDKKGKQLLVIARPAEQKIVEENVKSIAETFSSEMDQRMIPYPVYGMDLTTLQKSFTDAYSDIKIELDERGKRLLIWAKLDQHVKISDEIAKINGNQIDSNGEPSFGPRVAVYSVKNRSKIFQIQNIIATMFPEAEVLSDISTNGRGYNPFSSEMNGKLFKITVILNSQELKQLDAIMEQFQKDDEEEQFQFAAYPYGNADPISVEALLGGMLPNAQSLSDFQMPRISRPRPYYYGGMQPERPFYRVDPKTKTVAVFADTESHLKVEKAIESVATLGEAESQLKSKVYNLPAAVSYLLLPTIREIVPAAQVTNSGPNDLIVFATEGDLAKVDAFIDGISDSELRSHRTQASVLTLPANSLYRRDRMVNILMSQFSAVYGTAYPGANADQIIIWGTTEVREKMAAFVNEVAQQTEEEYFKNYPIQYDSADRIDYFLRRICPNATIEPDPINRTITVFGTAEQHVQVAKAIETLDKPRTEENEMSVENYEFDEVPTYLFWSIFRSLRTQFPAVSMIPDLEASQITITATAEEHRKVKEFYASFKDGRLERQPRLETYYLTKINFFKARPILQTAVPTAIPFNGKDPNEIFIWANAKDQALVQQVLTKLETVPTEGTETQLPKIYKLDSKAAATAVSLITPQVPGAVVFPLSADRIIAWGSPADQDLIAKILGVFAEAYPEPVLRKFVLANIKYAEIITFLAQSFAPDAVFYPTAQGDLMVQAPAMIQEKIALAIKELDIKSPIESTPIPIAYDISDIPAVSHPYAIQSIQAIAPPPDGIILPTVSPGYFILYAKPAIHEKVEKVVQEIIKEQPWLKTRFERYILKKTTFAAAIQLLQPTFPNARFGIGTQPNQLLVFAKPSDHEKIKEMIDKMNEESPDSMIPKVYRFEYALLQNAYASIMGLFPQVSCVPDYAAKTLTINATPDDHKKIEELVKEIDEWNEETQPSIQVFNLGNIGYAQIAASLQTFFVGQPGFQISFDPSYRSLIVQGTPRQRKIVKQLIDEIHKGGMADSEAQLKTYLMKNYSALPTLYTLFSTQGRTVSMIPDYSTGKLIVLGRPEEHKIIQDVLDSLAPEQTTLAIFELSYVDPQTAQYVIAELVESDGTLIDVRFDAASNQLFIRGTVKKLEEIRQILIQMGEKDLVNVNPFIANQNGSFNSSSPSEGIPISIVAPNDVQSAGRSIGQQSEPSIKVEDKGPFRTIQIDENVQKVLNHVQKEWDRENPLQIIQQNSQLIQTESNPNGVEISVPVVPESNNPAPISEDSTAPTPPAPVVPESNNPAPVLEDSAAPTPPAPVVPESNNPAPISEDSAAPTPPAPVVPESNN
ncbi:MAG: secretin N-terminal domain-containing protein, partial [Planctomycetia bacterium]|nr:secretin N-terminal domain-containing protein [Planctomycetia bacterium]